MIKVKNLTGSAQVYAGQTVINDGEYFIAPGELAQWGASALAIEHAASGGLAVWDNNGALAPAGPQAVRTLLDLIPRDVTTALERPDKDLVLASDEQPFVGNICTLKLKVPGELGDASARQIAGGYGFTDVYGWGDRVSKVELLDCDYVYAGILYPAEPEPGVTWAEAAPNGVTLGSYTDDELPEANRGWRLWADDGNQGGVDIDSLGGFGKLLALCYLTVTIEKQPGSPATRAALNAWWGKPAV